MLVSKDADQLSLVRQKMPQVDFDSVLGVKRSFSSMTADEEVEEGECGRDDDDKVDEGSTNPSGG